MRRRTKTERRYEVWKKAGGGCAHCGNKIYGRSQTVDHFIPKSSGGGDSVLNLMPLCRRCNAQRSSKRVDPWKNSILNASEEAICGCMAYASSFYRARRQMKR